MFCCRLLRCIFRFSLAEGAAITFFQLLYKADYVFRFFAGLGVGVVSVLVPLYQSEMAPKWIRGTLVCAYQLAITAGLLLAAIVNILTEGQDSPNAFRIPLALQFLWAGVLLLGLVLLPETPRYLIKRNLHTAAALSLSRLRRLDITHPALIENSLRSKPIMNTNSAWVLQRTAMYF